jgi:hypothetical protein
VDFLALQEMFFSDSTFQGTHSSLLQMEFILANDAKERYCTTGYSLSSDLIYIQEFFYQPHQATKVPGTCLIVTLLEV